MCNNFKKVGKFKIISYLFITFLITFFLIFYFEYHAIYALEGKNISQKNNKTINKSQDYNKLDQKEEAKLSIEYKNSLLSINAENTKLLDIINKISEVTKIKIEIITTLNRSISKIEILNLEIEKALEKLIGIRNFFIEYKKDEKDALVISKIYIIGQGSEKLSMVKENLKNVAQLILCGKNIYLFNDRGDCIGIRELPEFSFIKFSKDGNVYGIQKFLEFDEKGYPIKSEFKMYNKYGELLWTNNSIESDQFWISSIENGIASWSDIWNDNTLYFYNERGLLKRTGPLGEKLRGDYSLDGNYFAVSVNDYDFHGNLMLYNNKGNLIFEKKYNEGLHNVFITQKADIIALIKTNNKKDKTFIELINTKGDTILNSEIERIGDYFIDMAKNSNQIVVAGNNGKLYSLDITQKPSVVWKYTASSKRFWDVAISPDGNFIAGALSDQKPLEEGLKPRYINIFDKEGNILGEIKYDEHGFEDLDEVPHPVFSLNNKKLIVSLKNTIRSYNIEEFM